VNGRYLSLLTRAIQKMANQSTYAILSRHRSASSCLHRERNEVDASLFSLATSSPTSWSYHVHTYAHHILPSSRYIRGHSTQRAHQTLIGLRTLIDHLVDRISDMRISLYHHPPIPLGLDAMVAM
jgi:hypothetical protein